MGLMEKKMEITIMGDLAEEAAEAGAVHGHLPQHCRDNRRNGRVILKQQKNYLP